MTTCVRCGGAASTYYYWQDLTRGGDDGPFDRECWQEIRDLRAAIATIERLYPESDPTPGKVLARLCEEAERRAV